MLQKYQYLCLFVFFNTLCLQAQDTLAFNWINPSFEDKAAASKTPRGWADCGYFIDESPPDTHPTSNFGVPEEPYDGDTYLGMVVRENETWEAVAQRLSQPFEAGRHYYFTAFLATAKNYKSAVRFKNAATKEYNNNPAIVNFTTPVLLKVWAGKNYGDKKELLATSPLITHNYWKKYTFDFTPTDKFRFITLEAYYGLETVGKFAYNGNILIDFLSPIFLKEK
jgi:hypothetical protein